MALPLTTPLQTQKKWCMQVLGVPLASPEPSLPLPLPLPPPSLPSPLPFPFPLGVSVFVWSSALTGGVVPGAACFLSPPLAAAVRDAASQGMGTVRENRKYIKRPVKICKRRGEKYNGHWERNFIGEQKTVLCVTGTGARQDRRIKRLNVK